MESEKTTTAQPETTAQPATTAKPRSKPGSKPLATIDGPVRAEIYRSTFKPFDALKYLDRRALKKAEHASFEIGTVSGGGVSVTLAVELEHGKVTGIRPLSSPDLPKAPRGGPSAGAMKKVQLAVLKKLGELGPIPLSVPTKVALLWDDPWEIDIGPITIILGGGLSNICINVSSGTDGLVCSYCLFGPPFCSQIGPPL